MIVAKVNYANCETDTAEKTKGNIFLFLCEFMTW